MKENPKYQDIMKAAKEVFSLYGFKKASVEDVCKRADVAKMTFYKFFKNKTQLAEAIVEEFIAHQIENLERLTKEAPPYHEKLRRLIVMKIEEIKSLGTLFFDDLIADPELAAYLQKRSRENIKYTLDLLAEGQGEGYIRGDISQQLFVIILSNLQELVNNDSFRALFPDMEDRSREITRLLFHGIADPNNHKGGLL